MSTEVLKESIWDEEKGITLKSDSFSVDVNVEHNSCWTDKID